MSSPKADCEDLMNAVLPFAEQMLATHAEFIPFGGATRPDGEIVSIAGYDGSEHPKSVEIIALMKEAFITAAQKSEYKATAIVYDVRVVLPSTKEKSDAIAVSLNHRDGYSVIVLFPYKIDAAKLVWGEIFANKGEADIFPPPS
jgi:hypothetical protein